ncbi:MAG: carbohydrate kinase family protein [Sphingobacteriaceae bacterium]
MNQGMHEQETIVVGIGELLWDVLPAGKQAGGAPINFAIHAGQTGSKSYIISAVGNDAFGRELTRKLEQAPVHQIIPIVEHPTGHVSVDLVDGIPQYTIHQEVAWDYIPVTAEMIERVSKADAICFGSLALRNQSSRASILTLLNHASPDAILLLDLNLRQNYYDKELITLLLNLANAVKLNEEELDTITSLYSLPENREDAMQTLIEKFKLDIFIFTAGSDDSRVYQNGQWSKLPTPKIAVVDTIGAGDCFSGTLISSILHGIPLGKSHQRAVERAADVCRISGAWMPTAR